MAYILLANIGTRNLTDINPDERFALQAWQKQADQQTYRTFTKDLLDRLRANPVEWDYYQVNILNILLEHPDIKGQVDKAFLFASDQTVSGKANQQLGKDTIYAAAIVAELLQRRHGLSAEVVPLVKDDSNKLDLREGLSPVKPDDLIPFYRQQVRLLRGKYPEAKFCICESGGTPQQRTALRLAAEYLLPLHRLDFRQVIEPTDLNGNLLIRPYLNPEKYVEKDGPAYRRIIDSQQINFLAERGEYHGAATIMDTMVSDGLFVDQRCQKALRSMALRLEGRWEMAKNASEEIKIRKWRKAGFSMIQALLEGQPIGNQAELWQQCVSPDSYFRLCELLAAVQFYRHLENWSQVVITLHAFIEVAIEGIRSKLGQGIDYSERYRKWQKLEDVANLLSSSPLTSESNQLIGRFRRHCDILIRSNNENKFSWLRNKLAHEGRGVQLEELERITGYQGNPILDILEEWYTLFGLPDTNIYLGFNHALRRALEIYS